MMVTMVTVRMVMMVMIGAHHVGRVSPCRDAGSWEAAPTCWKWLTVAVLTLVESGSPSPLPQQAGRRLTGRATPQDRFLHQAGTAPAQGPFCRETHGDSVRAPASIVQSIRLIYLALDKGRDQVSGRFSRDYFW